MRILFSQAIEGFLLAKTVAGASPYTIRNYTAALKRLQDHLAPADPAIADIDAPQLAAFFRWLQTAQFAQHGAVPRPAQRLSAKTVKNIHTTLSSLWQWALEEGFVEHNIVRGIKLPQPPEPVIEPFSTDQIAALLRAAGRSREWSNKSGTSTRQHNAGRDRLIILLLLDTGVRVAELCNMQIADIDQQARSIRVTGKSRMNSGNGKMRVVYYSRRTGKVLWRYINADRPASRHDNLILTKDGDPMDRRVLAKTINRIGARAGVPDTHPHRFRHTFAIMFLRNGGDIFSLQRLLGHTTLDMVRRYLRLAQTDIANAHRRASPVANLPSVF